MTYELHQGDCIPIMQTLEAESVDLIVFSPPYNCRIQYASYHDEQPWGEYYTWMGVVIDACYRLLRPGGTLAINVPGVVRYQHDHAHRESWSDFKGDYKTHRVSEKVLGRGRIEPVGFRLLEMMGARDPHLREPIIWVKGESGDAIVGTNYQMGSDSNPYLRPAHELILLGSKAQWHHRGGTGRRGGGAVPFEDYTKDVWFIGPRSSSTHPAVFPLEIPARLIKLFATAPDAVVLDPFMGTGTTGLAALQAGKPFIGIEMDAQYIAMAKRALNRQSITQEVLL